MGSVGKCWRRCGGSKEMWEVNVGKVSDSVGEGCGKV